MNSIPDVTTTDYYGTAINITIMRNKTDSENIQFVSKKTRVSFSSTNNFETDNIAKEDMKHGTNFSDSFSKGIYYGFQEPFKQEKMTEAKTSLKIRS